jgi:hypothetical protein
MREEVTREERELYNEEIHNLKTSLNIIRPFEHEDTMP